MIEQKTIRISSELYNKYCGRYSHYYDPIEFYPQCDKDKIRFFKSLGPEGNALAALILKYELKVYYE